MDYREYEEKVRKLMDEHIKAMGTSTLTELVNIFDGERFDAEVDKLDSPVARADTILNRMKRTATEHMDEDPAFYRRFSELIEATIQAYREGRLSQAEYLRHAEEQLAQMRQGRDSSQPATLDRYRHAAAYYGVLREPLVAYGTTDDQVAEVAIQAEGIIERRKVTDWTVNLDTQNRIKRDLDNLLYDLERRYTLHFSDTELDMLIEQVLEVAKAREHAAR